MENGARRRWPLWRALVGISGLTLLIGVHLVLSAPMRVPIIHPDELGYLENARFLARGGLRSETEYYPGFSLLLVPLWWMSRAPALIYRQTLELEAVLAAAGGWVTWRLTSHLAPALAGWRRIVAVALVVAYPPFLLYGNVALAETMFVAVFGLVVLAAAHALPSRRPAPWLALGVSSGVLTMVHPRGLAVVVAATLMGLLVLGFRRSSVSPLAALTAGLGVSLAATRWLVTYVKGPVSNGFAAYRPDGVISKSLSAHGMASLAAELAGQLFYLSIATLGLVPLALLLGGRSLLRVLRGDRRSTTLVQGFVTLAFIGVWTLSSLFMNLGDRADKLIYGRYNEGVIVPLLVIALADVFGVSVIERVRHVRAVRQRTYPARRWFATSVGCIVVTALFVGIGHSAAALRGALNPVNVLSLAPVLTRMGNRIDPLVLGLMGVGAVAFLSLLSSRWPLVALVVIACVFAASTLDTETGYIVPGTQARAAQDDIAGAIVAIQRATSANTACIGYDADQTVDYNYYNDRFLLPGQRFVWFDGSKVATPCGTLVVSRRADFGRRYPAARLIVTENYQPQSLWAVPLDSDPTFGELDQGGWLAPPSPDAVTGVALPPNLRAGAALSLPNGGELALESGGSLSVPIQVGHRPGGAPWPNSASLHSGTATFAVQLAVRWYPQDDPFGHPGDPVACPSGFGAPVALSCPPPVSLPHTLLPEQHVQVGLTLRAVDSAGRPLAPGAYRVQFGLLQQGVGSFSDPPLDVLVTVSP